MNLFTNILLILTLLVFKAFGEYHITTHNKQIRTTNKDTGLEVTSLEKIISSKKHTSVTKENSKRLELFVSFVSALSGFLSGIGTFIAGIAACFAVNSFIKEKRTKRSEAASYILARIYKCRDEILPIAETPESYQFVGYPKLMSEGTQDEKDRHPELASRLVAAKIDQLRTDLHEPAARLSLQESDELYKIIDEMGKFGKQLSSAIFTKLTDVKLYNEIEKQNNSLICYRETFKKMVDKAEKLLRKIIETGK